MKTMAGLLAKAKGLDEEGINAFIWTGGYNPPPTTITSNITSDIMFVKEVVSAGEVAISDERSAAPSTSELAKLVHEAYIGGKFSGKAGRTHFHVGNGKNRLTLLRGLIDDHDIPPERLYPTHVRRSRELMIEAIELARQGSWVDIDAVDENLSEWLTFYLENGCPPEKITVSSDASKTALLNLFNEVRKCVVDEGYTLEQVLRCVTANTAAALKLE